MITKDRADLDRLRLIADALADAWPKRAGTTYHARHKRALEHVRGMILRCEEALASLLPQDSAAEDAQP